MVWTGTLSVADTTISGNSAVDGGGLMAMTTNVGALVVTGSTVSGNAATGAGAGGAGIRSGAGSLTIRNSTLSGNRALGGVGGAGLDDALAQAGQGLGGALFNLTGSVAIAHATLANNANGGIYSLATNGPATLAGLLLSLCDRVPSPGDALVHEGLRFIVEEADRRRVHLVRIERVLEPTAAEEAAQQ